MHPHIELLTIAKTSSQPNYPSPAADEWIRKVWGMYIYTHIPYIYTHRDITQPFAATWMFLILSY